MTALPAEYGPLVRELHSRAAEKHQPVNGTFELTSRCNLACRMCYIRQISNDKHQREIEISAEQWVKLAQQAVENGMAFLLLTGGEVFLRPDFFEIYTPLTSMGFILTLFTNGTLITEKIAARLAEAPPSRTEITIYGATKETYEAITGVAGSFERCIRGVELLIKYHIPLALKSTLTRDNVCELETMREMAHGLGLPFSASWLLSKRIDGADSDVENCRVPAEDCVKMEITDNASATDWTEVALRESESENNQNFYCQVGKAAFVINPRGEMNVCLDLNQPAAKPLEIGFDASWKEVQNFVDTVSPLSKVCFECDLRPFCPRCPAWSALETGTYTEPVPYLCEIARARKEHYDRKP